MRCRRDDRRTRGWVGYQCPFCNWQFGHFLKAAQGHRGRWRPCHLGLSGTDQKRSRNAPGFRRRQSLSRRTSGFVLDPNYVFAQAYGLRWSAPQETAYPSTFVIDRGGIVRYALVSQTHGGRSTAADVLAELRKLK